jgi:Mrp family chromosome partitioning ATPase
MSEDLRPSYLSTWNRNTRTNETEKVVLPSPAVPQPSLPLISLLASGGAKEQWQPLCTRCKQLALSLFFQGQTSVRSLGFTSAIAGEGKTFLTRLTAELIAQENSMPVTLLECNWENPTFSSAYNLTPGPGLSDWLVGHCQLSVICRQVTSNLTVIPVGDSPYNATQLVRTFQQRGTHSVLTKPNEILLIDLPATVSTAYGSFAAQLADALILVIHRGVTPEPFVTEACHSLKDLPVHGIVFNQVRSRIPQWLRRIL